MKAAALAIKAAMTAFFGVRARGCRWHANQISSRRGIIFIFNFPVARDQTPVRIVVNKCLLFFSSPSVAVMAAVFRGCYSPSCARAGGCARLIEIRGGGIKFGK